MLVRVIHIKMVPGLWALGLVRRSEQLGAASIRGRCGCLRLWPAPRAQRPAPSSSIRGDQPRFGSRFAIADVGDDHTFACLQAAADFRVTLAFHLRADRDLLAADLVAFER